MMRRIRREADLSQRELASALGISATAVAQAESGRRGTPVRLLCEAAALARLQVVLLDADDRVAVELSPAPPAASPGRGASGSAGRARMRHDHPQSTEPGR
jgi:transcriptional regulator with XRE-family HTH domain